MFLSEQLLSHQPCPRVPLVPEGTAKANQSCLPIALTCTYFCTILSVSSWPPSASSPCLSNCSCKNSIAVGRSYRGLLTAPRHIWVSCALNHHQPVRRPKEHHRDGRCSSRSNCYHTNLARGYRRYPWGYCQSKSVLLTNCVNLHLFLHYSVCLELTAERVVTLSLQLFLQKLNCRGQKLQRIAYSSQAHMSVMSVVCTQSPPACTTPEGTP